MWLTFGDPEGLGQRKRTRREVFLARLEQVVPWKALLERLYRRGQARGVAVCRRGLPDRGEALDDQGDQEQARAAVRGALGALPGRFAGEGGHPFRVMR